jgi:hypothetical protein
MNMSFVHETVIAVAFLQASTTGPQTLDPTTDRDTYAVYATLLPPPSRDSQATPPIVLQRETERPRTSSSCTAFLAAMTGEWAEVAASFHRENSRVRLLQPGALGEYKFVSRAEILADDARLAAEQPGHSNSLRPGAIEYVAFSAVGFNAAKTKAVVYKRNRTARGLFDGMGMWELKEGHWISGSRWCGGVA